MQQRGFTLVELLIAVALAAILVSALNGVVGESLQRRDVARERNALSRDAAFAMERMVSAVSHTESLLFPPTDDPASEQSEHIGDVLAVASPIASGEDGSGLPYADAAVVFSVDDGVLKERTPVPWDEDGDGIITEQDFVISDLVEGVSLFRVERLAQGSDRALRVDLKLSLTSAATGETVSLHTQVRVGGGL